MTTARLFAFIGNMVIALDDNVIRIRLNMEPTRSRLNNLHEHNRSRSGRPR